MRSPKLSIARVAGPGSRLGLFANGILVPGVKALFADADIMVVIDRDAVRIDDGIVPEPFDVPAGLPLATDGNG